MAWASNHNSQEEAPTYWMWITWGIVALAPWALFSRLSNENTLVWNGMVYDVSLCIFFYGALCFFSDKTFSIGQYVCILICIAGIIGFKMFE
jgi:hypothetical protein